jgi:hypothetical protein
VAVAVAELSAQLAQVVLVVVATVLVEDSLLVQALLVC